MERKMPLYEYQLRNAGITETVCLDEGLCPSDRTILAATIQHIPLPDGHAGSLRLYMETTMATSPRHRSLEVIVAMLTKPLPAQSATFRLVAQKRYLPAIEFAPTIDKMVQDLIEIYLAADRQIKATSEKVGARTK